jgi:hypothetical protein
MDMVRHNTLGIGQVISKDIIGNFTCLNVRFEDGKEMRFAVPQSFETGALEALGSLKDEVDRAIVAKKARLAATVVTAKTSMPVLVRGKSRSKKLPKKVIVTGPVATAFEAYLKQAGYSVETPSGNPSTVYSYINAVESVLAEEGVSWGWLQTNISPIVQRYNVGGAREAFGAKSNRTVISALMCFEAFANTP